MAGKLKLAAAMTVLSLYGRIWRTYFAWARILLPLACFVFVPLGLVHAIPVHADTTSLDLESGLLVASAFLASGCLSRLGSWARSSTPVRWPSP
jgi:hypothetical protein